MNLEEMAAQSTREINEAMRRARQALPNTDAASWKVDVPSYDDHGVRIERFEVSEQEAEFDKLRAAFNPQRNDRSVRPGTYTRLTVDRTLWMTDTPAEVDDLGPVDDLMAMSRGGTMLIVGLGLGLVLNRAITRRGMVWIDVVEREQRVIDAVGPHYLALAAEHDCALTIHCADIHDWRPEPGDWTIGFFDIWASIDMDDRPEVDRLRRRFRKRLGHFEAWAQGERNAQARRIRSGTGLY